MSVSSNSPLGSQATGNKSNTLLAMLSADSGAGNQVGPRFSQLLKDTSISSMPMPLPMPLPAPAPPARVESRPSPAPAVAAAPKPAPASDREQASDATCDESPSASAPAPVSDASKPPASNEAASGLAKEDKPLADGKAAYPGEALAPIAAADKKNSKSIKALPGDAEDAILPGPAPVALAVDQQRPVTQAAASEAGAAAIESLASLMPSVAQAVFPQDPRAQAAGAGKPDAKSAVPTSTEERAKVLSARAQQMAALTKTDAPSTDAPWQDLSMMPPDVSRNLVGDKTQNGSVPSFSSVMQATQAAAGAFAAPLNASASQAPVTSTAVHMKSDLNGPGFAPEMAARMTVLAGQGVQKAELHLNPAEMGPVSVTIALDGQDAQVQFHAQHAITREVLERSLPELAAALRDAGLTLSGGGVFQQPQDAKPDGQAQRPSAPGQSRDFGPDVGGSDPAPVTVRRTQVGVLDMYA